MHVLLEGVVEPEGVGHDAERLGVYAAPTDDFHGLNLPRPLIVDPPARILVEAREFCSRALACEPVTLRLLWTPSSEMETVTPLGEQLIELRDSFLQSGQVAYSYVKAMEEELAIMGAEHVSDRETFGAARRMHRLGVEVMRLDKERKIDYEPKWLADSEFADTVVSQGTSLAVGYLTMVKSELTKETSLPVRRRTDLIESWLHHVRNRYYFVSL